MQKIARHLCFMCGIAASACTTPVIAHAAAGVSAHTRALNLWSDDSPMQQRYEKCQQEHGTWYEKIIVSHCVDDSLTVQLGDDEHRQRCDGGTGGTFEQQCVHIDHNGQAYFNDGPSIPQPLQTTSTALGEAYDLLLWNDLFWSAGVNHDYCYGYNPVTYGYTRAECDAQFLEDLAAACEHEPHRKLAWFSEEICTSYAAAMYSAVSVLGDESWNAQSSEVYYGGWRPLWKEYGLPARPSTEHMKFYIEMSTSALSWWPWYDYMTAARTDALRKCDAY